MMARDGSASGNQGKSTRMLQTTRLEILRCANGQCGGKRCLGELRESADALICNECGVRYPIVKGVGVFKLEDAQESDGWFESMYAGRSRFVDLASDYLRAERAFMARFAVERGLAGPCLEIGCGTGCFAETVPDYIGLDYSLSSLLAEGFGWANRICGDGRWLPVADSSVECVFSFNTLEHVPDVELAFGEIDRVLRPGGYLVLKPAWHCTRSVTELIPVLPYSELNLRQKLVKALLPVFRSKAYKVATRVPHRVVRRLTSRRQNPLRWGRLTPYHGVDWVADADAVASIDCHEGILYYVSRGYRCLSHARAVDQILAGHDLVVLYKPA
jgi:SAM-dependent methyltransferase